MADDDKRTKIGTGTIKAVSSPAVATPAPVAAEQSGSHATEYMHGMGTPAPSTTPAPAQHQTSYLPPTAPKEDPLIGQVLAGRYLIRKKLGEGGMGAVYLASHQLLEKDVALKVLHNEFARKADLVERFIQEAKAASRIRHENVIDISDFGSTNDNVVFFAMELLNGHDLHEEIARARLAGQLLPYSRTKKIFLQICSALAAAHSRGIVHRDLKPENIYLVDFLGDPDFVKLLDFGIAKLTEVSEENEGRKLTKTGMLFGTPEYMSPEQARGEHVNHRVDIYAMGCILFQLVTNRVPFEADNFMGVLSMHLTEHAPEIPPVVFERIGAPPELAHVIDRALAKDRDQRFQTIDELANAVRQVSGDPIVEAGQAGASTIMRAASVQAPEKTTQARAVTPAPAIPTPVPMAPTSKRTQWTGNLQVPTEDAAPPAAKSKLPLIIGAVAVIAIAGVIAFFATRGPGESKEVGSASGTPSGSQIATNPPPPPIDAQVTAPPQLPKYAEIKFDSKPQGADIFDVATKTVWAKTPKVVKIAGSTTPRQFKYVLKGYTEVVFEVVPNEANMDHFEKLDRGTGTVVVGGGSGSQAPKNPGSGSGSAVAVNPGSGSGSAVAVKVPIDAGVKPPDPPDCEEVGTCIKTNIIKRCTTNDDCGAGKTCKDGACQ